MRVLQATLLLIYTNSLIAQAVNEVPGVPDSNAATSINYKARKNLVLGGNIVFYTATTVGLYESWYKGHPFGNFKFVNDNVNWQQVDKCGHAWSGYIQGRIGMAMWQYAGYSHKKAAWTATLTGFAYQNLVEILDGFSAEWGYSWGDYIADIVGAGLLLGQELGWKEQRILYKLSFIPKKYESGHLQERADEIYGKGFLEQLLNDYNAQSYWLSVNLRSFFRDSKIPKWLNVAVGYGAEGMYGEKNNKWKDANDVDYNRSDIKRYRQVFLSPDIDLSRFKTNSKVLNTILFLLNSVKIPFPSLEFSNGKVSFGWN